MIHQFYVNNMDFLSAESRNVKSVPASTEKYGDDAVGFVQVKREQILCTVKAKITPEHKVRSAPYGVTVVIDEATELIHSCQCADCAASAGSCKHSIALLFWLHRRAEEPSVTDVQCYWKKAKLSTVGSAKVHFVKCRDFAPREVEVRPSVSGLLQEVVQDKLLVDSQAKIMKYLLPPNQTVPLHYLGLKFVEECNKQREQIIAANFKLFCTKQISVDACVQVEKRTKKQSDSAEWYEYRYGRITASKLYEAAHCSTTEGALFESILGARTIPDTIAIRRGRD